MALKKIRFLWATPPLPNGRWRLGLFNYQQMPDPDRPLPAGGVPGYWKAYLHHTLHFSVRGLLRWGSLFAVLAYFAAAALLYLRYENANPHNRIGYLDLVLPTRWSQRTRLQGEGLVLLAREKLSEGRFSDGFGALRLGVAKNPADLAARLDLARLYLAIRLRPRAEKLLREGLDLAYPGRAYLEVAFALAADGDTPAAWAELCLLARTRLDALPPSKQPAGDSRWLDQQTVKALVAARRGQDAAALVAARYPKTDPFRREITVIQLIEHQNAPAAITVATEWAAEQPDAPEPLRLLVRAHREARDFAAMDKALGRLRALNPTKPDALLYALVQNHLADRPGQARAALDELLFRHGANPGLYPALCSILVEIHLTEELPRLTRELSERGLSPRPALWARFQADIAAHAWTDALAEAEAVRASPGPAFTETQSTWLETMVRLARACADAGSGEQSALVQIVADHPGTLRLYRLLIDALLEADRIDTAARILSLAEGPYPAALGLSDARRTIETRLAASMPAVPPAPAAPAAGDPLASLATLSAAFSLRIQEKDTAGALALLGAARRARPAWLIGAEPRLDELELPLHARGEDPLRLQLLARQALMRDADAPKTLLALAFAAHAEGHPANGLLLVKEILRHSPEDPEALALLATWAPRTLQPPLDVEP